MRVSPGRAAPPTVAFEIVGPTLVVVFGNDAPSDAEWQAHIVSAKNPAVQGLLIVTAGGGPTAAQREQLAREKIAAPAAVVTRSVIARGIVTALSWLGQRTRAFAPAKLLDAMDFAE